MKRESMRELNKAMRRLEKSTGRLSRRRARSALRSIVAAILKRFPPIDREGREQKQPTRPTCPICGIPCKTWQALVAHIRRQHIPEKTELQGHGVGHSTEYCPCCRVGGSKRIVAAHFAGLARAGKLHGHLLRLALEGHLKENQ